MIRLAVEAPVWTISCHAVQRRRPSHRWWGRRRLVRGAWRLPGSSPTSEMTPGSGSDLERDRGPTRRSSRLAVGGVAWTCQGHGSDHVRVDGARLPCEGNVKGDQGVVVGFDGQCWRWAVPDRRGRRRHKVVATSIPRRGGPSDPPGTTPDSLPPPTWRYAGSRTPWKMSRATPPRRSASACRKIGVSRTHGPKN